MRFPLKSWNSRQSQFVMGYLHRCNWLRKLSTRPSQPYFITTPIFYVNAAPHIGHVYTAVLTDASARFHRMLGYNPVIFSTGTDEHGLKIQKAAQGAGKDPASHCEQVSELFRRVLEQCEISSTDFIRTTEQRHKDTVREFWTTLQNNGYIYKGKYEGWYCTADETFVSDNQTKMLPSTDGTQVRVSAESERPVEWSSEENYMFSLSKFREPLCRWLSDSKTIQPIEYRNSLLRILSEELPDLSVSRPRSRLTWGIPVPGDDSQTVYVWLDALLNYLTVAKSQRQTQDRTLWPANVHVIGKDIVKFHGIYWPAFLMAAGMDPPCSLLVHGHWMADDQKMSKTLGNVVDPGDIIEQVGVTGLRYFLLHEGVPSSDGNFSRQRMIRIVNAELADGLGNLVSRSSGKALNPAQIRPALLPSAFEQVGPLGADLLTLLDRVPGQVRQFYSQWKFYKGIESTMTLVRAANHLFQTLEPWNLKKRGQWERLNATVAVTMEAARVVGVLLQPVIPSFSSRLLGKLSAESEGSPSWEDAAVQWSRQDRPLAAGQSVLFPRIKC